MKFSFFLFLLLSASFLAAAELRISEKKIVVNGKVAAVYAVEQPDGTPGIRIPYGQPFDVLLTNSLKVPSSIHWHGLILPNNQDGVAFITQFPLYPNLSYHYEFPLKQSGTYWMHAHYGLQEQRLLMAPLIINGPDDDKIADLEVILMLADFSFKDPSAIYRNLLSPKMKMSGPDLVEVDYDAFLTNSRTLQNPEVIEVQPNKKVRLRIINGSSATNFFVQLDKLKGDLIAVDGNPVRTLQETQFEIAIAQRLDIVVKIPEDGVFPVLAQGEGTDKQTGLILATKNSKIPKLEEKCPVKAGALTNDQEKKLKALNPLQQKAVDRHIVVELGGNMADYAWTINGQAWPESTPILIGKGERVEFLIRNKTGMSHPMHLHGHVFQVKAINGVPIDGAMRDTVLVTPNSTLSIQFDADNPGVWPFHCHVLYHLEAGMFTVVRYADFIQPL